MTVTASFSFFLFRAAPAADASSRAARGPIGAAEEATATATAAPEPSRVCDLHHSSQQRQSLNPLSEARERTFVLMDAGWVR